MGSKTKENPGTMLYSSFFLHSTVSLYPVREVIFQLKLLVNFCWLLSMYLEKDVVCNRPLSIYLIKQVKMILLSCSLVQLSCFISFTDMQHTFCWTFDFLLIDSCLYFQHFSDFASKDSFQMQLLTKQLSSYFFLSCYWWCSTKFSSVVLLVPVTKPT